MSCRFYLLPFAFSETHLLTSVVFPKPAGGRDESQFAVQALVQLLDQARAEDNISPAWGDIQFRG